MVALPESVRGVVRREDVPVVLTAALLALPTAVRVRSAVDITTGGTFLLLVSLVAGVPRLYHRWPRTYPTAGAVAWTVAAVAVVAVEFVAVYALVDAVATPLVAAAAAFLVTDLVNTATLRAWRLRAAADDGAA
jgi:hypothetical protein